jgi:serine/threonine-protein kinase
MLAQTYAELPAVGNFPVFDASAKGQAAAAQALELDPKLSEAYAALGQIRQNFEWDFESAERSYRRALLFNSGNATAHQWHAESLLFLGQVAESENELETALDLDPVSPGALAVKAFTHVTQHDYPAANRILERILATTPDYPIALIIKTSVAMMIGAGATVGPEIQHLAAGDPQIANALTAVAVAASDASQRTRAEAALKLVKGKKSASELALWYALAGLKTEALANIKAAYESGADPNLPFMLLHPAFDAIRSTPDYQKILRDLHMTAV